MATFPEGLEVKFKTPATRGMHVSAVKGSGEVRVQRVTVEPGGHTGWHSHEGPVVVAVSAGTVTLYDGDDPACEPRTFPTGTAFVDPGHGHVHIARNEGTTEVELWATYFMPAGGNPRVDAPAPGNCAF